MLSPNTIIKIGIACAKTQAGKDRIDEITFAKDYAERGYSLDHGNTLIVFGNWNDITEYKDGKSVTVDTTPSRICTLLEKAGCNIEWSDEWTTCDDCGLAVRTSGDSYGWKAGYVIDDFGVTCQDCLKKDPAEYLEGLEGNCNSAVTVDVDLAENGYKLVQEGFENGLHEHMAASPKLIGKALNAQGLSRFIFTIDENSQFYSTFSVWLHEDEFDKLDRKKFDEAQKDQVPTPATIMKNALRGIGGSPV